MQMGKPFVYMRSSREFKTDMVNRLPNRARLYRIEIYKNPSDINA